MLSSTTAGQQKLGSCINISKVVKAETIWTLKVVDCRFSFWTGDNASDLFSTMFIIMFLSNSAIARGFQIGKTKTMYEITHGLAPYVNQMYVCIHLTRVYMKLHSLLIWTITRDFLMFARFQLSWSYKTPGFTDPF